MQRSASRLLRDKGGLKGKQALLKYDPWLFFTTLQDGKFEKFNPQIGITDPVGSQDKALTKILEQLYYIVEDPIADGDRTNRRLRKSNGCANTLGDCCAKVIGDVWRRKHSCRRTAVSYVRKHSDVLLAASPLRTSTQKICGVSYQPLLMGILIIR